MHFPPVMLQWPVGWGQLRQLCSMSLLTTSVSSLCCGALVSPTHGPPGQETRSWCALQQCHGSNKGRNHNPSQQPDHHATMQMKLNNSKQQKQRVCYVKESSPEIMANVPCIH